MEITVFLVIETTDYVEGATVLRHSYANRDEAEKVAAVLNESREKENKWNSDQDLYVYTSPKYIQYKTDYEAAIKNYEAAREHYDEVRFTVSKISDKIHRGFQEDISVASKGMQVTEYELRKEFHNKNLYPGGGSSSKYSVQETVLTLDI
jgi:hypothetical protein